MDIEFSNPSTPKIYLEILLTVFFTLPIILKLKY